MTYAKATNIYTETTTSADENSSTTNDPPTGMQSGTPLKYPCFCLLAPTGALIVMMAYYISKATVSDFTQSLDAIDVTSVTLSCLNSMNAIDVTRYLGNISGIF